MSINPDRWTVKTQEAFSSAADRARAANNPEITPDHLLAAVRDQADTLERGGFIRRRSRPGSAGFRQ